MYISPGAFSNLLHSPASRDNTSYNALYIFDSALCTVLCALYTVHCTSCAQRQQLAVVQIAMRGTNPSGTNPSGTNLSELVQIAGRPRGQSKA